ncbi:oligosaccharide flippase family protein [Paenibacillus sp. GP183]|uniref:oligosaccharide flippase family protein n=1 Tax=Paenibacillus sp. GP183 TaxID=1882751 RepID=UPI00089D41E0|nr:oligosaccharide flippase family protein [Paenibacillus sp. GP183]SEB99636.1 Membrane protein involved in the export of O-antigen and teichoic acid [Paenibacillus sp. GP183]
MTKNKMHFNDNQRFLMRSFSIIVLGLFINQLLQTVGSIVVARLLNDPIQFGEVNLLLQVFGMVTLFLNLGFNSSLVYTFSTNPKDAIENKFRLAMLGSVFFGVIISILLAVLAPLLARTYALPSLKGALILSSIMLVFNSIINIGVSSFSGNRNFGTQAFFMVTATTFSTAGTVIGVLWPAGDEGFLWGVSIWMGVGAILAALFISWKVERVHHPKWRGSVSIPELGKMLQYGIPLWAGNIAKAFQQPFLVMIIGTSSVIAVGHVSNAIRITGFIGIITWAFMIVTFPFVAASSRDLMECKRRGTLCIRYNNLILYPLTVVICLFPNQINGFLFGDSYTSGDSAAYIRLLALGVFFSSVGRLGGNILAGIGKTKANFWVMIVAGIFVITLVPLIAASNPVLAVWIYTGGWAMSAISMIWFFYLENFTLDWWKAYGEPLIPSLVMGFFMEVGRFTGAFFTSFVLVGVLCLIVLTLFIETRAENTLASPINESM